MRGSGRKEKHGVAADQKKAIIRGGWWASPRESKKIDRGRWKSRAKVKSGWESTNP